LETDVDVSFKFTAVVPATLPDPPPRNNMCILKKRDFGSGSVTMIRSIPQKALNSNLLLTVSEEEAERENFKKKKIRQTDNRDHP
jgi:hypothetical protein